MKHAPESIKPDTTLQAQDNFEDLYIRVRNLEKRVYSDDEVRLLPDIHASHIHSKEWQIRKTTANRIITYLKKKNKALKILEVGCGNGWLSAKLAGIKNTTVTGIDINNLELNQAKRVFKKPNLNFICDHIRPDTFGDIRFDVIVFAASIQYFESFEAIMNTSLSILNKDGEVHVADTNFYRANETNSAIERTKDYYTALGYPELAAYYFHRRLNELDKFNHRILSNPRSLLNRLKHKNPFYWIKIRH